MKIGEKAVKAEAAKKAHKKKKTPKVAHRKILCSRKIFSLKSSNSRLSKLI